MAWVRGTVGQLGKSSMEISRHIALGSLRALKSLRPRSPTTSGGDAAAGGGTGRARSPVLLPGQPAKAGGDFPQTLGQRLAAVIGHGIQNGPKGGPASAAHPFG